MKALILFSSIACLLLFSCKKDHQNNTAKPKMYLLSYSVSSFSQQVGPITNASGQKNNSLAVNASLKDSIDRLYFCLYNPQNDKYDFITQYSSDPNFGTIRDSVVAGSYKVAFIGVKNTDFANVTGYTVQRLNYNPGPPSVPYITSSAEIFSKTFAINVSASATNQHVVMDRVVGQIQVNIQDALPANFASVKMTVPSDSLYYNAIYVTTNHNTSIGNFTYQKTITAADRATTPYQISAFTRNFSAPFTLTLSFYDAQGTLLVTKTIPNVTCKANTRTILTGKIVPFSNNNFQITLNSDWGSPINSPF